MTAASAPSSLMAQGFSRLVTVEDPFHADELMSERSHQLCAELESGNLVVLPRSSIVIPDEHRSLPSVAEPGACDRLHFLDRRSLEA